MGVERTPDADLALISVPGSYAAAEASKALALGLHVMLFSDNVIVEEERAMKTDARERGLLVMGPDCGTAIVNGVPLGFANVVRRGDIGLVAASGTGLQEVTCRIHQLGGGVSQALGTGGRDLKDEIGGITMLQGIAALADDPATRVIVLISKPPSPAIARQIQDAAAKSGKPVVVISSARRPHRSLARASSPHIRCSMRRTWQLRWRKDAPPPPAATAPPVDRVAASRRGDGADAARRARAVHRRHLLLRGATRVP